MESNGSEQIWRLGDKAWGWPNSERAVSQHHRVDGPAGEAMGLRPGMEELIHMQKPRLRWMFEQVGSLPLCQVGPGTILHMLACGGSYCILSAQHLRPWWVWVVVFFGPASSHLGSSPFSCVIQLACWFPGIFPLLKEPGISLAVFPHKQALR